MPMPPLKHVVDRVGLGVNLFTTTAIDLAIGTLNPDPIAAGGENKVRAGSILTSIILQLDYDEFSNSVQALMDWYVWYNIAGVQGLADPSAVNPSLTKNQIFHQDGAMSFLDQRTSIGVIDHHMNSWRVQINIPKQYRQINDGDKIQLVIKSNINAATQSYKIKAIYKEYYP